MVSPPTSLRVGHGFAHASLKDRIDVGEEEKLGIVVGGGDLGLERSEDVQIGVVGLGFVEIVEVGAFPEEAFAGGTFDAACVDLARVEDGFFGGAEVFADDGDDADVGEEAGGEGEVGCCAAEAAFAAARRCFDGVE